VRDGNKGTSYISGWHLLPTKKECEDYLTRFSDTTNKIIIKCKARGLRSKIHSRSNVFLANEIFVKD